MNMFSKLVCFDARWIPVSDRVLSGTFVRDADECYMEIFEGVYIPIFTYNINTNLLHVGERYSFIVTRLQQYVRDDNNEFNKPVDKFIDRVVEILID